MFAATFEVLGWEPGHRVQVLAARDGDPTSRGT